MRLQRIARSIVRKTTHDEDERISASQETEQDTGFVAGREPVDGAEKRGVGARRRRVGRRVVRGTGAAGAAMKLKVEELEERADEASAATEPDGPQEHDPVRKPAGRKRTSRKTGSDVSEPSATSTGRSAEKDGRDTQDEDAGHNRASSSSARSSRGTVAKGRRRRVSSVRRKDLTDFGNDAETGDSDEPTPKMFEDSRDMVQGDSQESRSRSRTSGSTGSVRVKPSASLLFQEPVIPTIDAYGLDDEAGDEADGFVTVVRTGRGRRRLNAEERRASDEVEQIEEDLAGEHIEYAPIDDGDEDEPVLTGGRRRAKRSASSRGVDEEDMDGSAVRGGRSGRGRMGRRDDAHAADDEGGKAVLPARRTRRGRSVGIEGIERVDSLDDFDEPVESGHDDDSDWDEDSSTVRRRSRRRARGDDEGESRTTRRKVGARRAKGDDERDDLEDAGSDAEEVRSGGHDEEEGQPLTRRRRRRRAAEAEGEDRSVRKSGRAATRSRKQQYIDEITDIEGSTRLEAKKQRRRDNRRERSRQSQILEQDFLARRENVNRLMVVRQKDRHTQISVIEDDVLVEHYVSDIQEVATVGNIYLGRVQNVLPSMEAAFVDIGQARNGVLYAGEVNWDTTRLEGQPRRIELAFKSGDPVLVQVTKDPIGHKGARLTSQVTLAGRFLVLVPSGGMTGVSRKLPERERTRLKSIVSKIAPKDMGVIIRTAAEGASEEAIGKDLEALRHQWEKIEEKHETYRHGKRAKLLQGEPDMAIRVVRDIFNDDFSRMIVQGDEVYSHIEDYLDTMAPDLKDRLEKWDPEEHEGKDVFDKWQIDSQLRKGMERQVYLPSGGSIVIDRTEAMTTIDVNTGRFIGKGKSLEETVTRCNLEASEEIARQLRLRDIGGMIMIDYVDMVMPANRDLVLRRLVECLARDRTKHQVAEVTSLGLVQMTRKRIGQGLVEAFSEECPTCKGRGFILHDEPTVSAEYSDPYAMKGGDPFVKTNKHGHGASPEVAAPQGSSPDLKAKLAQIAAAAAAAGDDGDDLVFEGDES